MSTVIVSACTRLKLLQVSPTSRRLLHTKVSFGLHRGLRKGTELSLSTTGQRALQTHPCRGSHTCQNPRVYLQRDVISHSVPLMSAEGGRLMEVKLSFRREHSCLSVLYTTHTHTHARTHTHTHAHTHAHTHFTAPRLRSATSASARRSR